MAKQWKLKALTDIWTGDLNRKENAFKPTGLLGSIRWWYEVLVRGLGGKACDPTADDVRCPARNKKPHEPGHHCVVCELFGCTGWARKFRLVILDENGKAIQNQIRAGQTFILKFIPLRPIAPEEWCLLDATLRLIAECGAIGGKTVLKPSEEWGIADLGADDLDDSSGQVKVQRSRRGLPLRQNDIILKVDGTPVGSKSKLEGLLIGRYHGEPIKIKVRRSNGTEEEVDAWAGKRHHRDFGLVAIEQHPGGLNCNQEAVKAYVSSNSPHWHTAFPEDVFSWASLQNFWCVKGRYLARQDAKFSSFNKVIGRHVHKGKSQQLFPETDINRWLAGRQQESKKVFSFKQPEEGRRTFGFVKPRLVNFDEIKRRLRQAWPNFQDGDFKRGDQILDELFQQGVER